MIEHNPPCQGTYGKLPPRKTAETQLCTCKFCDVPIRSGDECPACYRARCDDDDAQRAAQEREDSAGLED